MLGHSLKATPSDDSEDTAGLNNLNRSFEKEGGPGGRPGSKTRWVDESNPAGTRHDDHREEPRERNGNGSIHG